MSCPRETVRSLITQKAISWTPDQVRDLEIGVYNWTILESSSRGIIRNWTNHRFSKLYIEKARSVVSNIDANSYIDNKRLLQRCQDAEFFPHDIAFMKPENIYPEKWKTAVDALMKKYENAYENKVVAMTTMFKCGKCKKRECTFYELQTRSGDESTTIFIRCVNCGNSWRQG